MKTETKVKELNDEFIGRGEVRGFKFRKLASHSRGYLYEVVNGEHTYYEVFKRRINTQYGNVSYPTSKAFGRWAWWIKDLEKAEQRLETLRKQ